MAKKINFVVKVTDAKLLDIKKALEAKNIKLDSIIEVYKEEIVDPSATAKAPEQPKAVAAAPAAQPAVSSSPPLKISPDSAKKEVPKPSSDSSPA
ncbi:MAG: hypothetical protein HY036_07150 [Nitrospirae bacterium]|nr:hypothetical protein [Nitrospirota bacterium]MBI3352339.1 hypothetical protein [Nitrospirota bacterium]